MMNKRLQSTQRGFTLLELIFAMAGFSIMLIIAVSGFLNAVYIYNQANVSRDNQQQVRRTMEQISGDIRSAQGSAVDQDKGQLCLQGATSGSVVYYLDGQDIRQQRATIAPGKCADFLTTLVKSSSDVVVLANTSAFKPQQVVQDALSATTVRLFIGVQRGAGNTVRARQFTNAYSLQSSYLLRGNE